MVGVLITDTNFYTACSSGNGQPLRQLFDSAVGQITVPALTVCNDINFGRLKNRGASTITHQEVSLCQRIPASPVGVCAAPKMIHAAIQNGDSGTWVMSEIFYNPALDLNRPHQETIQSCPNCARLLPMMMCSDIPLSDFRGSLQSATRGQYMPG